MAPIFDRHHFGTIIDMSSESLSTSVRNGYRHRQESAPSAEWVVQQLREAFPEIGPYRYVILDRDSKFDATVITFLKATGLQPKRTSIQSPWQIESRKDGLGIAVERSWTM